MPSQSIASTISSPISTLISCQFESEPCKLFFFFLKFYNGCQNIRVPKTCTPFFAPARTGWHWMEQRRENPIHVGIFIHLIGKGVWNQIGIPGPFLSKRNPSFGIPHCLKAARPFCGECRWSLKELIVLALLICAAVLNKVLQLYVRMLVLLVLQPWLCSKPTLMWTIWVSIFDYV